MKIFKTNKQEKGGKQKKVINPSIDNKDMSEDQIREDIDNRINQITRHKKEIDKLTDSVIEELMKLCELRQKIEVQEEMEGKKTSPSKKVSRVKSGNKAKGGKRKKVQKKETVEVDYELANMNMIKKLLDLSDNLQYKRDEFKSKMMQRKGRFRWIGRKKIGLEDEEKNGRSKILIVEDDPTTVNIVSYVLSQHNYRVSSTLNAEDGLKMTLKERPDLIILDIMLPGMDGFQLLSVLKENEETTHIPVVLISSLTAEKDILKGLEIGADDYILKPFSPQILYLKVKKILGSKNGNIAYHNRL